MFHILVDGLPFYMVHNLIIELRNCRRQTERIRWLCL